MVVLGFIAVICMLWAIDDSLDRIIEQLKEANALKRRELERE